MKPKFQHDRKVANAIVRASEKKGLCVFPEDALPIARAAVKKLLSLGWTPPEPKECSFDANDDRLGLPDEDKRSFTIKVGGRYRLRAGLITGPMQLTGHSVFVWSAIVETAVGRVAMCWTADGKFDAIPNQASEFDIVSAAIRVHPGEIYVTHNGRVTGVIAELSKAEMSVIWGDDYRFYAELYSANGNRELDVLRWNEHGECIVPDAGLSLISHAANIRKAA